MQYSVVLWLAPAAPAGLVVQADRAGDVKVRTMVAAATVGRSTASTWWSTVAEARARPSRR